LFANKSIAEIPPASTAVREGEGRERERKVSTVKHFFSFYKDVRKQDAVSTEIGPGILDQQNPRPSDPNHTYYLASRSKVTEPPGSPVMHDQTTKIEFVPCSNIILCHNFSQLKTSGQFALFVVLCLLLITINVNLHLSRTDGQGLE